MDPSRQNNKKKSDQVGSSRSMHRSDRRSRKLSSGRLKHKRRARRKKALALWVVSALILLDVLVVGYHKAQNARSRNSEPTASGAGIIDATNILNAYLDSIGGRDVVEELRSVRYEGRASFGEDEYAFSMTLLWPDKGMFVLTQDNGRSAKYFLNGNTAWRSIYRGDDNRELDLLDEEETQDLQWSFRMHNTFRSMALEGEAEGLTISLIEYRDRPCYEVTKTMPDGSEFLAILDKKSLYLLKSTEHVGLVEGQQLTVLYDDHRMESGVVNPFNERLYRDGKFESELRIESFRSNIGVLSAAFEIPDEFRQ